MVKTMPGPAETQATQTSPQIKKTYRAKNGIFDL